MSKQYGREAFHGHLTKDFQGYQHYLQRKIAPFRRTHEGIIWGKTILGSGLLKIPRDDDEASPTRVIIDVIASAPRRRASVPRARAFADE